MTPMLYRPEIVQLANVRLREQRTLLSPYATISKERRFLNRRKLIKKAEGNLENGE